MTRLAMLLGKVEAIHNMDNINTNIRAYIPENKSVTSGKLFHEGVFVQAFECMLSGVAYGKVLHHNGKPYDFIFFYTNLAFQKQLGCVAINGQRASELFPELYDSNPEIFIRLAHMPIGGSSKHCKIYLKSLKKLFSVHMFIPKSEHVFFIFEKITRTSLMEQQYNQLLAEQKAVLDNNIVGIAKIRDRKFIWVNRTFEYLLGYSFNELMGQPVRICYPSDEGYADTEKSTFKALASGKVCRAELQLIKKDRSLIGVAFNAELLGPHGVDMLVMLTDITQKKEIDLKLRAINNELQDLYDNAPCGYHSISEDGTFQKINKTELSWLGVTKDEAVGKMRPTDFFTAEGKEIFARIFPQLKATGHIENVQLQLVSKSGFRRWVSVSASVVKDKNEKFLNTRTVMYDITEIKKIEDQVRQHAFYDTLTHLPNRHLLEDRLTLALSASERSHCYGALLFLDLDNFKPLNDSHGHSVGDLLLIEVARRLKKCVREIDTVSRFGGDEFVIIISELSTDNNESVKRSIKIAKKIQRTLIRPYCLAQGKEDNSDFYVKHICSASIGISLFVDNTKPREEILRQADSAMYRAKNNHKNSIYLFNKDISSGVF